VFAEFCSIEVTYDTTSLDAAVHVRLVLRLIAFIGVSSGSVDVGSIKAIERKILS